MNAGIQGLAADIFKVALVRLDARLRGRGPGQPADPAGPRRGDPRGAARRGGARRPRSCWTPWSGAADAAGAAGGQPVVGRDLGRRQGLGAAGRRAGRGLGSAQLSGPRPVLRADRRPRRRRLPAVLVHQGHRAGGGVPAATRSAWSRACGCSTWAAARAATSRRWPRSGVEVVGVDISLRLPAAGCGAARSVRADARRLPVRPGSFDAAISPVPGRLRAARRRRTTRPSWPSWPRRSGAGRAGGGERVLRLLRGPLPRGRRRFDAATGVNHERTDGPQPRPARRASSTCGPLLHAPGAAADGRRRPGLAVEALWSVAPGDYAAATARPRAPRVVPAGRARS